jgi:hypothetical protein
MSPWTRIALPGFSAIAQGGAVLILALVGLRLIITAPFTRRRQW